MAGIYIHIPFCRKACHYCDFHFSISRDQLPLMLQAIEREIIERRDYLQGEILETVYLGGGTPSLLTVRQLKSLLGVIRDHYKISKDPEITMEGNPDDLSLPYMQALMDLGINRLSIGIQSFQEDDLTFMNRSHGTKQSHLCLEMAREAGFQNLNIDLIYGLPGMSMEKWEENIELASGYFPEHIAAYHLTYEKGTVMDYRRRRKKFPVPDEKVSLDQYELLIDKLQHKGYMHYEISNFALSGHISRHNSAYWKGGKYLGAGPSAHSFNGSTRRWNMPRNTSYIKNVLDGVAYYESEELDKKTRYHDYVMTSLRTMWGIDLDHIGKTFGQTFRDHCIREADPFIQSGRMTKEGNRILLSKEGFFIADHIIESLFLAERSNQTEIPFTTK
jgi:oxygen-independent coproporphyrinogen-3 oxidase